MAQSTKTNTTLDYADVICIGAINYDYVFTSKRLEGLKKNKSVDDGEEGFLDTAAFEVLLEESKKLYKDYNVSVGGSALLALKATKELSASLKTAYVGVYGTIPGDTENKADIHSPEELKDYLKTFIDNDDWLFYDDSGASGRAVVNQFKKKRKFIEIDPGVNINLLQLINDKGASDFLKFLASAKWIHITSLPDVDQFVKICKIIKRAKAINKYLRVSIDPGFSYTKHKWLKLRSVLEVADFLFLSKKEYVNICDNLQMSEHRKIDRVCRELRAGKSHAQVIIIKGEGKTMLLSLVESDNYKRTYYHKRISRFSIMNDTGAGDVFAGGFIAGMLTPTMLSYQPAPIYLAATAAREKLKAEKWPEHLKTVSYDFFEKNMKKESRNYGQKVKMVLKNPVVGMVAGAAIGKGLDEILEFISNILPW